MAFFLIKKFINLHFQNLNYMAVTRLKRKDRRNKAVANNKTAAIKQLLQRPEIRKVDIEEIKKSFAK